MVLEQMKKIYKLNWFACLRWEYSSTFEELYLELHSK